MTAIRRLMQPLHSSISDNCSVLFSTETKTHLECFSGQQPLKTLHV